MSHWKYGMILIARKGELHPAIEANSFMALLSTLDEDLCALVELYEHEETGEYHSFCATNIDSPEDLAIADRDVTRDGVNTWFYDNGKFFWDKEQHEWHWVHNQTAA